ncbi:hypothetical protein DFP72DRAFT_796259, partial [Ephemerocybe angulata]
MYETFKKHEDVLDIAKEERPGNGARQMLTKVVNSLSSKMEVGAPMAALYLLQNPDHYTSHQFVPFYWRNYFNYVQGQWSNLLDFAEPVEEDTNIIPEDPDVELDDAPECDDTGPTLEMTQTHTETVQMTRKNGYYLAKSNTDDYRFRPSQLDRICLYDFIQCSIKHPIRSTRHPRKDLRWFRLLEDHPHFSSHAMALDPVRREMHVPHFIGPSLPRRDGGNREDYCCAMLTLFCPWRTGIDLKSADITWEEAFNRYVFSERQTQLMANFNMRYECYDARDDYGAIVKSKGSNDDDDDDSDDELGYADDGENAEDDDEYLAMVLGKAASSLNQSNSAIVAALKSAGWKIGSLAKGTLNNLKLPTIAIDSALRSSAWNNIIKVEKLRAWRRKIGGFLVDSEAGEIQNPTGREVRNDVYILSNTYLSKDFVPPDERWRGLMSRVISDFKLNPGQEKAFRIIANHACCIAPEQLLMHLGGMGGTGKSTVIRALCQFFTKREEEYRFVLLGPTGTSAALIGGSTYHTFLGLHTGKSTGGTATAVVEEVRE